MLMHPLEERMNRLALQMDLAEPDSPLARFQTFVGKLDRMLDAGKISGMQRREVIQRYMRKHGITTQGNYEPRFCKKRAKTISADPDGINKLINLMMKGA